MSNDLASMIKTGPHWRLVATPDSHVPERIPTLGACLNLLRSNAVSLRGWDFPFVGTQPGDVQYNQSSVSSSIAFVRHERWELFQSGQFVYLGSLRENSDTTWNQKIRESWARRPPRGGPDPSAILGFIDFVNALYELTEYFEFVRRLYLQITGVKKVNLSLSLLNAQGVAITAEFPRNLHTCYVASSPKLERIYEKTLSEFDTEAASLAIQHAIWLFDRFGWSNVSLKMLTDEQARFLKGL